MPPVAVLDACFSTQKQSGGIGLAGEWLRHVVADNLTDLDSAKYIFVTCVSAVQSSYVKKLRKLYPNKKIIVGGAASTSPYSLGKFADCVCVGDGQNFIHTLFTEGFEKALHLSNVWVHGEDRDVGIDQSFPWSSPPIQAEDGAFRLWCGRGCKNKCLFCQTGWALKYSEHPNPDQIFRQVALLKQNNKKFAYLSNDPGQHSFGRMLPAVDHGSFSVKYIKKFGLPKARQIRLGVEGVSERLRKFVNKPISYDDLLKCTSWLNANKKSVRFFMIAGLPGETDSDWDELRQLILDWKRITPKGVLALSFTAFCPDPATPLAVSPLNDDYWSRYESFKEWFFGGIGWSNRIKLMGPQQPENRMIKAIESMGLSEQELRKGGNWGPNDRLNYPYKKAVKHISCQKNIYRPKNNETM